jgi:hypothetical protein
MSPKRSRGSSSGGQRTPYTYGEAQTLEQVMAAAPAYSHRGCRRIVCLAMLANPPKTGIAEKVGMSFECRFTHEAWFMSAGPPRLA